MTEQDRLNDVVVASNLALEQFKVRDYARFYLQPDDTIALELIPEATNDELARALVAVSSLTISTGIPFLVKRGEAKR